MSITISFPMNLMGYHVYREVWKPVKDESITFRLEPNNEYDKWAVAVGHLPLGVSRLIAEQMQNGADLTTNSGEVSKSLHLIPAPP